MGTIRISDIKEGQKPGIITVRVLKQWISKGRRPELCYLFVDQHGDAIDAVADLDNKAHFDSLIKIQSCYNITEYVAIRSRRSMSVTSHNASIRIGLKAEFKLISDESIPKSYYNFVNHEVLEERVGSWEILTDYIVRVVNNKLTDVNVKNVKVPIRKIKIKDESNKEVTITLWEDKKDLVDSTTTFGDIIAITSARVTEYGCVKQLESTHYLTEVIVNPTGPHFQQHIDRLQQLPFKPEDTEKTWPITIHELLQTLPQPSLHQKKTYTCKARIFEIQTHRNWYFARCSECKKPLQVQHNGKPSFACADHKIMTPNFQYCLNALITDDTETTKVIIYNETMLEFLKIDCQVMVQDMGYYEQKVLPPPISTMIGVAMDLNLTVRSDKSVTISRISKTSANTSQSSSSSTPTGLPPPTPNPKSTRPTQQKPGSTEKKQKLQ